MTFEEEKRILIRPEQNALNTGIGQLRSSLAAYSGCCHQTFQKNIDIGSSVKDWTCKCGKTTLRVYTRSPATIRLWTTQYGEVNAQEQDETRVAQWLWDWTALLDIEVSIDV